MRTYIIIDIDHKHEMWIMDLENKIQTAYMSAVHECEKSKSQTSSKAFQCYTDRILFPIFLSQIPSQETKEHRLFTGKKSKDFDLNSGCVLC